MFRRFDILRDNPVLRLELRRYGRRTVVVLCLILFLWLPIALIRRSLLMVPALMGGTLRVTLTELLHFILRPDILLGFFLMHQALTQRRWRSILPELRTTCLGADTILAGKLLGPMVLLVLLSAIAAPYRYADLVFDRGMWFEPWGMAFAAGGLVAALAWLEDVFFVLALLLIASKAYLSRRDELMATVLALLQVFGLAVLITLCGIVPALIPYSWFRIVRYDMGIMDLTYHLSFFALVLPAEWLIVRITLRQATNLLKRDLGPKED